MLISVSHCQTFSFIKVELLKRNKSSFIHFKYVAFSTHKYFKGPSRKSNLSLPPFTFRVLKMFFCPAQRNATFILVCTIFDKL